MDRAAARRAFPRAPLPLLVLLAALAIGVAVHGQQTADIEAARTAPLAANVPVDPAISTGTLPNGVRYYVRANRRPERQAEFRLVLKAGSILEDNDQRGLAHLLEHVAVTESKNFAGISTSMGVTSFDETTYSFMMPTTRPTIAEDAVRVLQHWASGLVIDPDVVDNQRDVVIEEIRMRSGVNMRLFPYLLQGSRYGDRSPQGLPEIILNAPVDAVRRFYRDWYRPNLMGVVAVGDFDAATMEARIKAAFSPMTNPANERPRPSYDAAGREGTQYLVITDREATGTSVAIHHLVTPREQPTNRGYRTITVDRLFGAMLNRRFAEMAREPNPPFLAAATIRDAVLGQVRARDAASLVATVKDDGVLIGLEALGQESARLSRFGFTAEELDVERQNALRRGDRMLAEQTTRDSSDRAAEYIRNFLTDEALPTTAYEYGMMARFLPEITLAEVNALAAEWFSPKYRIVIVSAPLKSEGSLPDQAKLEATLTAALSATLAPKSSTVVSRPLMTSLPEPGRILRTTQRPEGGTLEWDLANGIKVVLKPTTVKADEVVFVGMRPGGASVASDADYVPAATASLVLQPGGLGDLNAIELRNALTGRLAGAQGAIGDYRDGIAGGGSSRDLETMFQLIHLVFTRPRADRAAFETLKAQTTAMQANESASPEFVLAETVADALMQKNPRQQALAVRDVAHWDLDKSLAFYKSRFANATGFTFVFAGNVTPGTMQPLVERYLASLPSTGQRETVKDLGIRPPQGVVERTVYKGVDPRAQVVMTFTGPFQNTVTSRASLRATAIVLEAILTNALRDLGAIYSISVEDDVDEGPSGHYTLQIHWTCDPARSEEVIKRVQGEILRFGKVPASALNMVPIRDALLRDHEQSMQSNVYVAGELARAYHTGEDPARALDYNLVYERMDALGLLAYMRQYLDLSRYVIVRLLPEKQ